ncbi:hypothetical protein [Plesiomonas shigelloides]|uniref:hypothetical protein n=1 Tax=Plesiomonas shigelloides TaxID=703 RepID=UPI00387F0BAE
MDMRLIDDSLGAATFFAIMIYPEESVLSYKRRNQLIDAIMYIAERRTGIKPNEMKGIRGFACKDFSQKDYRYFERHLTLANNILLNKIFLVVHWLTMHGLTGEPMYKLWEGWQPDSTDSLERARKEVFRPYKPVIHLAWAFSTTGLSALAKNNVKYDLVSCCCRHDLWLKDVVSDSNLKLSLLSTRLMFQNRNFFQPKLELVSHETVRLTMETVKIPPSNLSCE